MEGEQQMNNKVICQECESVVDSEVEDGVMSVDPCTTCIDARAAEWTEEAFAVKDLDWIATSPDASVLGATAGEKLIFFIISTPDGLFRLESATKTDPLNGNGHGCFVSVDEAKAAANRFWVWYLTDIHRIIEKVGEECKTAKYRPRLGCWGPSSMTMPR
jgi:hypothetical protein